jgi:uncharacterized protein YkwD
MYIFVPPFGGGSDRCFAPMPLSVTRIALLFAVAAGTLALAGPAVPADYGRFLAPASACPAQADPAAGPARKVRALRCLVSYAREKRGLPALRWNARLERAAALKLRDNARCDEFSHTACGKPFISVFRRSGYVTASTGSFVVGENLAWGQGTLGTPRRILLAWLRSDGHRHNLFSRRWRQMGAAYRFDGRFEGHERVALWANSFGRRDP